MLHYNNTWEDSQIQSSALHKTYWLPCCFLDQYLVLNLCPKFRSEFKMATTIPCQLEILGILTRACADRSGFSKFFLKNHNFHVVWNFPKIKKKIEYLQQFHTIYRRWGSGRGWVLVEGWGQGVGACGRGGACDRSRSMWQRVEAFGRCVGRMWGHDVGCGGMWQGLWAYGRGRGVDKWQGLGYVAGDGGMWQGW